MNKRAILYARVSGDDRQNSTSSIQGQLDLCREYAIEREYVIVRELAEDDKRPTSGASWDLPELNNALNLAREQEFDILVVRELDRLARGLAKQLVLEEQFESYGIKIEYVLGDYANTPEGQLNKQIRAVIAEYEREKISERMVRGRRRKVQAGSVIVHGNPPYGYRLVQENEHSRLEIVEEMARVVRMIFDWYINEFLGAPTIARKLNALGIPPPSVAKKTAAPRAKRGWSSAAVSRLLKNETYAGTWHYGKKNTLANHKNPSSYQISVAVPAIISRKAFDKAQAQCKRNFRGAKRNTKREYLLAKRCFCGECGTPLVVAGHKWNKAYYNYYRCQVPHNQVTHYVNKTCNMRKYFRTEHWDDIVWQEIKNFLADHETIKMGLHQYQQEQDVLNEPMKNRLQIVTNLLLRKEQEYERLLDLYLNGEFDKGLLHDRKQRLQAEMKALETEHNALKGQFSEQLTDTQIMEILDFVEQVAEGLKYADTDFKMRQKIVLYLDVRVTFSLEEGEEVAYLYCQFGLSARLTKNVAANEAQSSFRRPESGQSANSPGVEEDSYISIDKRSTDCNCN